LSGTEVVVETTVELVIIGVLVELVVVVVSPELSAGVDNGNTVGAASSEFIRR
jgi:hypothetical protein